MSKLSKNERIELVKLIIKNPFGCLIMLAAEPVTWWGHDYVSE